MDERKWIILMIFHTDLESYECNAAALMDHRFHHYYYSMNNSYSPNDRCPHQFHSHRPPYRLRLFFWMIHLIHLTILAEWLKLVCVNWINCWYWKNDLHLNYIFWLAAKQWYWLAWKTFFFVSVDVLLVFSKIVCVYFDSKIKTNNKKQRENTSIYQFPEQTRERIIQIKLPLHVK